MESKERRDRAFQIRMNAALAHRDDPVPATPSNGDERTVPEYAACFTKCLPHNELGLVDPRAYELLLKAMETGSSDLLEAVPLGAVSKLADPMASFAYSLEGADAHSFPLPAAPAFRSAEQAGEMVELYWRALTRDVPYSDYANSPLIAEAAADLSRLSTFRGPKLKSQVTAATIYRGSLEGELQGPLVSQFLWKQIPYGSTPMDQIYRTAPAGYNYLTGYAEWLANQRGFAPSVEPQFDGTRRYIRSSRDLAMFVSKDFSFQAHLNASLMLLGWATSAFGKNNEFFRSRIQTGFISFGSPHVLDFVTRAGNDSLKAAWCHKWLVHRRLRPEAYGGRLQHHLAGTRSYPIHPDLLNSAALKLIHQSRGTYLLPQAYPEGCPAHPSYPAGHAVISGACITILKAFFPSNAIVPDPVVATADGLKLVPYTGPPLTVGGELNKLASNITFARDVAGIHYRSDGTAGLALGEAVAISVLQDLCETVPQKFSAFQFPRFDGNSITIQKKLSSYKDRT